jgi:hypothetical protein
MSKRPFLGAALIAATALLAGTTVAAHHSVPGSFHDDKTTVIKGKISKIDWINPHVYIYVDVKDKAGAVSTWKIESIPTNHMRRAGITKAEILEEAKAGDVTVHMYPSIKNPTAGFLLRLTYPAGHFMQFYGDDKDIARASN